MIRRFNRYELKFIIPVKTRDALLPALLEHMTFDPHGAGDGSYRVTSLYYDSADLSCYRAKLEGIKYRRKVRLRLYGEDPASGNPTAMVEIKQRINRTVQKRRIALPLDEGFALCKGHTDYAFDREDDRRVVEEVQFLVRTLDLRPACVISYLRQAYVGSRYEPNLRVTFDQVITCAPPHAGLDPTHLIPIFDPRWLVMEVKADEAVPVWVSRLLSRNDCQLRRISKYCAGIGKLASLSTEYQLAKE